MEDGCIIRYMKRLLKAKNSEADEKADGRPTMKKLYMWKRILLMMLIAACSTLPQDVIRSRLVTCKPSFDIQHRSICGIHCP